MLKKIYSIFAIFLIFTGCFFHNYSLEYPVYADSTTEQWEDVTSNAELAQAFRYYCKSRNLTIDGSVLDAVTSFTTSTFTNLCNTLGVDMTALQANLKKSTDSNGGLRFLFDSSGISTYNRIFSEFLQNNNLSVGDTVNDQTLYEGRYFTDDQLNSCFVYEVNTTGYTGTPSIKGTPYIYDSKNFESLSSSFSETHSYNNISYTLNFTYVSTQYYRGFTYKVNNSNDEFIFYYNRNSREYDRSNVAVIYNNSDHALYIGMYNYLLGNSQKNVCYLKYKLTADSSVIDQNTPTTNIYLTTNNLEINNNVYEGDTIIGDDSQSDTPDPDTPDPDTPDPPTLPETDGWQDFQLPSMPNDWLIYGMERKFPFDIPFNIMFALSLLNHEPEIPKFEGDLDLKVCTWHYNIDLTPFDEIASIFRKFEVLAFIIGLALLTKQLINWG